MATKQERAELLKKDWATNPRWKNVTRAYSAEEVINISGSVKIEYSLAKNGAEKLWDRLQKDKWVAGLGARRGDVRDRLPGDTRGDPARDGGDPA